MLRRPISILLSAALAALAPGLAPYEAWAGVAVGSAGTVRAGGATAFAPAMGAPGSQGISPIAIAPGAMTSSLLLPDAALSLSVSDSPAAPARALPALSAPRAQSPAPVAAPAPPARIDLRTAPARAPPSATATVASGGGVVREAETPDAPVSGKISLAAAFGLQSVRFDGAAARAPGRFDRDPVVAGAGGRLFRPNLLRANGASSDREQAFDAEFEIGPEAISSGVEEPRLDGTLDASKYRVPAGLRLKRAGLLALHYAGIAGFASFLAMGLGWVPALAGFAAAAAAVKVSKFSAGNGASAFLPEGTTEADLLDLREDLIRQQNGEAFDENETAELNTRSEPLNRFMQWAEGAAQVLVTRAGFDGYHAPRLWYNESHSDPYAAHSSLGDLDRSSSVYIGVGFLLRPLGETLGMMAHEFGHLFHGDYGFLRERFRLNPGGQGLRNGARYAVGIGAVATLVSAALFAASAAIQGAAVAVDPVSAAASLGWIAAAFASAFAGLIAGFGATRQDEFRADNFSAWLTHPQWWISWLRMRKASRERAFAAAPEESVLSRWWDALTSTHPDYDSRIAFLQSLSPGRDAMAIPALPAANSIHGLNGETQIVLEGLDRDALSALQGLSGPFEAQVFFVEDGGASTGHSVVRVHRTDRAILDSTLDSKAVEAVLAAVRSVYPAAVMISAETKPHAVFRWTRASPTARRVLRALQESDVPIRWDTTLGAGDARGVFRPDGESGPEILINPAVFFKGSPKALLAVIAHEAYHARVYAHMRELGIDWLSLGGLEFERLAHSTGLRVFAELGGERHDDIDAYDGGEGYVAQFERWRALDESAHLEHLQAVGYGAFSRLSALRAMPAEDLAVELGIDEDPAVTGRKLEALWRFYQSERGRESRWGLFSFFR